MNTKFYALYISFFFLSVSSIIGQKTLADKMKGVQTLSAAAEIAEEHYSTLKNEGLNHLSGDIKEKHWQRLAYYLSSRTGTSGEFVDAPELIKKERTNYLKKHGHAMRSTNSNWSFIGPDVSTYANGSGGLNGLGRVNRIAFHPTQPNTLFACTSSGGTWRSTDDGSTWEPLTDSWPETGSSGVVVSHSNLNTMYILTGDGDGGGIISDFDYRSATRGVIKSTDGGANWYETGPLYQGNGPYYGYRLRQHPTDALTLFTATNKGLYRTTNGGVSWTRISSIGDRVIYDIEFHPTNPDTMYVSGNKLLYYSNNGGDNFTLSSSNVPLGVVGTTGRVEITTTPANPAVVYALVGPAIDTGVFRGVFLSLDAGESYFRTGNTPNILGRAADGNDIAHQSGYDLCIAASHTAPNVVITGGLNIWKSTTSATSFYNVTTYGEDPNESWYVHPDIHDVAFHPTSGKLYAAGDGGMYKSLDAGENWVDISIGLAASQIFRMDNGPGDVNVLGYGSQDNGIKLRTSNTSDFQHVTGGDGFDVEFVANDPTRFYITVNEGFAYVTNSGSNRSWRSIDNGWFKNIATHTTNPNTVFVGSDTIFQSFDNGVTWNFITDAKGSWAITTCPSNVNRIYAAGWNNFLNNPNGELYVSSDGGSNWSTVSNNPGFFPSYQKITDLGVRPTNSSEIWASFGSFEEGEKVLKSTNGGVTWTNMTGTLPNIPINCISIDENGDAYIGTDIGVFYRPALASDWIPFSNNLPVTPVTSVILYESLLRVSTFGRGVWQSAKPNSCTISMLISGNLSGGKYYEVSSTISSTSNIFGGYGTNVVFNAGGSVVLQAGFEVKSWNNFEAKIGGCN